MALTSFSTAAALAAFSPLGMFPVTEKLTRNNHPMWKLQVLSGLRGAEMEKFIDPVEKPPEKFIPPKAEADNEKPTADAAPILNPEFKKWVAQDQQVLSYLLGSLSREIGSQITAVTTAAEAWTAIQALHASQSRARIISTRMALATASKGASSISEFVSKMKALGDEMASAGRKLEDEELISYILTGLDREYDPVVTAVAARVEPITVNELYAQLVSFEQRMEARGGGQQSSVNMASKGGRGGGNYNNNARGGGRGGRRGGRKGGRSGGRFEPGVYCQVCGKEGHPAYRCYNQYDSSYQGPPQKTAAAATSSYGVDTNWYMDTGATDHVTGELEKLTVHDKYHGGDQVHAANGTGMEIANVGHSFLHSPNLHLRNILHVPQAHKNLCSVNRLARDNNVFLEFHPNHFFIKDQVSKKTIHTGRCEGGALSFEATVQVVSK